MSLAVRRVPFESSYAHEGQRLTNYGTIQHICKPSIKDDCRFIRKNPPLDWSFLEVDRDGYVGTERSGMGSEKRKSLMKSHAISSHERAFRSIFMIRNPLDVIFSVIRHILWFQRETELGNGTLNVGTCNFTQPDLPASIDPAVPLLILEDYLMWYWSRATVIGSSCMQTMVVNYEDLLDRQRTSLMRIFEFIGEEYTKQDFDRAIEMFPPDRSSHELRHFKLVDQELEISERMLSLIKSYIHRMEMGEIPDWRNHHFNSFDNGLFKNACHPRKSCFV